MCFVGSGEQVHADAKSAWTREAKHSMCIFLVILQPKGDAVSLRWHAK
jgi:hypothetical protein